MIGMDSENPSSDLLKHDMLSQTQDHSNMFLYSVQCVNSNNGRKDDMGDYSGQGNHNDGTGDNLNLDSILCF